MIDQAWEGGLRTFDQGTHNRRTVLLAKTTIAQLARVGLEPSLQAVGRQVPTRGIFRSVPGMMTASPLGYSRPPWALAFDQLYQASWQDTSPGAEGSPPMRAAMSSQRCDGCTGTLPPGLASWCYVLAALGEDIEDVPALIDSPPEIRGCLPIVSKTSPQGHSSLGPGQRRRHVLAHVSPRVRHLDRTAS